MSMIEQVGVVGCGLMGSGIVENVASRGLQVVAVKATGGDVSPAREKLARSLDRRVRKGKISEADRDAILGRVRYTTELSDLSDCDLVIESAVEAPEAKITLLQKIEQQLSPGAILASNTSSLPLESLASNLSRPAQFVALHFFNPVPVMKLVELSTVEATAPGVRESAKAFCERIGKVPVQVAPSPGYVVNRLLVPYLLHGIESLEAGIASAQAIDQAMTLGCGHPMGPLALSDLIGLDVVHAMAKTMDRELGDGRYKVPALLSRLVLAGQLGRKTQLGIYDYAGDSPVLNGEIKITAPGGTPEAAEA